MNRCFICGHYDYVHPIDHNLTERYAGEIRGRCTECDCEMYEGDDDEDDSW